MLDANRLTLMCGRAISLTDLRQTVGEPPMMPAQEVRALHSPSVEKVLESVASIAAPIAFFAIAGVVFYALPDGLKKWLTRWRGVFAAGCLSLVAAIAIGFGIAILTTDDHFGAATSKDAYITGPFLMVLGLVIVGFAVAAYRNNPLR